MKKLIKIYTIAVLTSGTLIADGSNLHLYELRSGKVTYEIKGSGNPMGTTMKIAGKKRLIFNNYGAESITEENKVKKQTIMGRTHVVKTHTMTYIKDGVAYLVDFKQNNITRRDDMGIDAFAGQNMKQLGEKMLKQMGGKKTGTDKVLGFTCDVWELKGIKQCIYKGVTLKITSDVMGLKTQEVATKAEFDIPLQKDSFKLPNFPVYDMEGNELDKSKLESMDKQAAVQSEEARKGMEELGKTMANAAKQAGVKEGATPTKEQEQSVENALLMKIKKKSAEEKRIWIFAKECFEDADTLQEAQSCEDKANKMIGRATDPNDRINTWDKKTKKEILNDLEASLKEAECIQKAKSMQDMDKCSE